MNKKHAPNEYILIEKWGHMLGTYDNYIKCQQELAAQEGAPLDALYKTETDNQWHTSDEVVSPLMRRFLGLPPRDPQKGTKQG